MSLCITRTGGVKSEYIWDGTQLAGQKNGTGTMLFLYEGTGLSGFQKDGVNYYYLRNGQNDIVGILDASGNRVVSYTYDAWGKLLTTTGSMASTIGAQNPFRYRGYYFDTESGLYYLQSRYYDPNTGRFLNADGQLNLDAGVLGVNLFAYCNNNSTNYFDPDGHRMLQAGGDAYVINGKVFNDNSSKLSQAVITGARVGYIVNAVGLPKIGKPNSKDTLYNSDGTPKQERSYGPDGEPVRDRDYNHGGKHDFPHDHEWNNGVRGPATPVPMSKPEQSCANIGKGIAIGVGTVGAGYLIYRGIRMIPSLFPANVAIP